METRGEPNVLERIVVGAVGLTVRALVGAAPSVELTVSQWRAVVILGEAPDGLQIGAVAARVGVTPAATGRLLRRLERRGLVSIETDAADRRAFRASLTEEGALVRREILDYRRRALDEVARGLTAADGDMQALLEALAIALGRWA